MRNNFLASSGNDSCRDFLSIIGISRREMLRVGGLGIFGLSVADLLAQTISGKESQRGRAKACILMFMWGGPSQLDTWDLKPVAPAEVRGEFKPIATSVLGIQISEH